MNILAIDTSSDYLSLGLQSGSKQCHILEKVGNKQSELILPQINDLLRQNNIKISDINLIAYNQGPGSFTGLRIGLSVAMGIALGLNINIVPVPAFAIYAYNAKSKLNNVYNKILVAIDARLNQIYFAGLDIQTMDYFLEPIVVDPSKVFYVENSILIGNGFKKYFELLPSEVKSLKYLDIEYPDAKNILNLVLSKKYLELKPHEADLLYLRNKVALDLKEQQKLKK